jgi:hypothetical protein
MQQDRNPPTSVSTSPGDEVRHRLGPVPVQPEPASRKLRTRAAKTSEERWNQLQREYQRAVLNEYPNPKREGCPGTEALRDLAEKIVVRGELQTDVRWKHAIQCGPCFEEYVHLRGISAAGSNPGSRQQYR